MKRPGSIVLRGGPLATPMFAAWLTVSAFAESLPDAYRAAKTALESGEAAKAAAILEPRLAEARGEQRGVMLFTLGVAQMKLERPADAERTLAEAKGFAEKGPRLAETWALIGDARVAQEKTAEAGEAYGEAVRASESPETPIARYASARSAE